LLLNGTVGVIRGWIVIWHKGISSFFLFLRSMRNRLINPFIGFIIVLPVIWDFLLLVVPVIK